MPMPLLLPTPIPTRISSNFDAKRFSLRSLLLWAGLLAGSTRGQQEVTSGDQLVKTEQPLMLGSPTATTVHISTTRTVTITITYRPTLAPGDGTYTLLGCYGEPKTGHIFNEDGSYKTPDGIAEEKLTIEDCLKGCAASKPPEKELAQYAYAGMKNGSECFCGSILLPEVPKLPNENCTVACTGDAKLSCGGLDAVAIYGLIGPGSNKGSNNGAGGGAGSTNGDESNGGGGKGTGKGGLSSTATTASGSGRLTSTGTSPTGKPTATSGKSSSSAKATGTAASSSSSSDHSGSDSDSDSDSGNGSSTDSTQEDQNQGQGGGGSSSAPGRRTVAAAVGGSMSGAVVLAALLYFCFRAYRRKRARQDEHVTLVLDKKKHKHEDEKKHKNTHPPTLVLDNSHRDIHLTIDGVVPTTPTLESGSGRRLSTADDSLFRALMGDVRHGGGGGGDGGKTITTTLNTTPATGKKDASGQSSAVQWRRGDADGVVPPSPRVPFGNGNGMGAGGSGIGSASPGGTTPAAAAAATAAGAGAIAGGAAALAGAGAARSAAGHAAQPSIQLSDGGANWHRRKASTPYPSQKTSSPLSSPPPRGNGGGNNGRSPAPVPAPPPSAPLPRSVFATTRGPPSGPPNMPLPPTPMPPRRPRRSFDTLDLSVGSSHNGDMLLIPSPSSSRASRLFGGRSPPPPLPPLPQPTHASGGSGGNRNSVFGNAAASASTPSLSSLALGSPTYDHHYGYGYGYGYDGNNNHRNSGGFTPTAPLNIRKQGGSEAESGSEWDNREPTIPVLPPIRPGEKFDPQRWRGTIYAGNHGDRDGDDVVNREISPLSATTVGTSILDSPTVNHWGQR